MAHICRLMVADFEDGIGRHDEDGRERYDRYNLECAVIYCEDYIAVGVMKCPVQGWDLAAMKAWAAEKLKSENEEGQTCK